MTRNMGIIFGPSLRNFVSQRGAKFGLDTSQKGAEIYGA